MEWYSNIYYKNNYDSQTECYQMMIWMWMETPDGFIQIVRMCPLVVAFSKIRQHIEFEVTRFEIWAWTNQHRGWTEFRNDNQSKTANTNKSNFSALCCCPYRSLTIVCAGINSSFLLHKSDKAAAIKKYSRATSQVNKSFRSQFNFEHRTKPLVVVLFYFF